MGIIQGSINNLLATAGLAARLSPDLEKRRQLQNTGKQIKGLETARLEAAEQGADGLQLQIAQELADKQKELAYLDPSEKNIKDWKTELEGLEEQKKIVEEEQEVKQFEKIGKETEARLRAESAAAEKLKNEQERARISESFRNWRNL